MKSCISENTYNDKGVECPYCGHIDKDSWELGDGGEGCGETECGECEKTIIWVRNISVSYEGKIKE